MDGSDSPLSRSPRRELQGPRPTPLRISRGSHKIKKPPAAAPQPQQQQPPRAPVVIYTVSPKVIHANPSEFMTIVQRLTGLSSNPAALASSSSVSEPAAQSMPPHGDFPGGEMLSPAARYAAIERANATSSSSPEGKRKQQGRDHRVPMDDYGDINIANPPTQGMDQNIMDYRVVERSGFPVPGILSPGPSSLPPISSGFFSSHQLSNPNPVGFHNDLISPGAVHATYNRSSNTFFDGGLIPSPNSSFLSPYGLSPSSFDFSSLFDP